MRTVATLRRQSNTAEHISCDRRGLTICSWCEEPAARKARERVEAVVSYGICDGCLEQRLAMLQARQRHRRSAVESLAMALPLVSPPPRLAMQRGSDAPTL